MCKYSEGERGGMLVGQYPESHNYSQFITRASYMSSNCSHIHSDIEGLHSAIVEDVCCHVDILHSLQYRRVHQRITPLNVQLTGLARHEGHK